MARTFCSQIDSSFITALLVLAWTGNGDADAIRSTAARIVPIEIDAVHRRLVFV